jgi:hypothetical protein
VTAADPWGYGELEYLDANGDLVRVEWDRAPDGTETTAVTVQPQRPTTGEEGICARYLYFYWWEHGYALSDELDDNLDTMLDKIERAALRHQRASTIQLPFPG